MDWFVFDIGFKLTSLNPINSLSLQSYMIILSLVLFDELRLWGKMFICLLLFSSETLN
jgi:hypothetical protein